MEIRHFIQFNAPIPEERMFGEDWRSWPIHASEQEKEAIKAKISKYKHLPENSLMLACEKDACVIEILASLQLAYSFRKKHSWEYKDIRKILLAQNSGQHIVGLGKD